MKALTVIIPEIKGELKAVIKTGQERTKTAREATKRRHECNKKQPKSLGCGQFGVKLNNREVLHPFTKNKNITKKFSKYLSVVKIPSSREDAH